MAPVAAPRRFLFAFLTPVLVFVMLVLGLALWQQKVTGGLTRVGRWSERDFGTHLEDDDFKVLANRLADGEPDVLVLGDSFSLPNLWQTVLSRATGQRVLSYQMNNDTCIRAWAKAALELHPGAKTIIVETVERGLLTRGANKYDCATDGSRLPDVEGYDMPPARSYWPLTVNLEYLGHTLLHTVQQDLHPNDQVRGESINVPLRRDDLFSSRRSDRLLYYVDDEKAWHAGDADIDATLRNFADLNARLTARGVRLIVLVVPDKSHVYRGAMKATSLPVEKKDIPAMLRAQGVECPALLAIFVDEAMKSVDFYQPDDTHLSERGYRILGQQMVRAWTSPRQSDAGQAQ